jgi:hypothetical protein
MQDFWGGLFGQPEVRLVTGEAFVRRSREQYDAILSVHHQQCCYRLGALALAKTTY